MENIFMIFWNKGFHSYTEYIYFARKVLGLKASEKETFLGLIIFIALHTLCIEEALKWTWSV